MLPPRPFFSGSRHIFTVMQAYLAAQRTLSGFLLACLPPPSLCLSSPCAHQCQTLSSRSSDGARPCKPSPAPLWSEKSQSQPQGSSDSVPPPMWVSPLPPDPTPTLSTRATTNVCSPQHAHFPGCLSLLSAVPSTETTFSSPSHRT